MSKDFELEVVTGDEVLFAVANGGVWHNRYEWCLLKDSDGSGNPIEHDCTEAIMRFKAEGLAESRIVDWCMTTPGIPMHTQTIAQKHHKTVKAFLTPAGLALVAEKQEAGK